MKSKRALAQRVSVGVVDQLLSSGSNFLATLIGAHYLSAQDFGAFSVAMLSYMVTLGLTRGLCAEALLVRPGATPAEQHRRASLATAAAAYLGAGAGAVFALSSLFAHGPLRPCLVIIGVTLPALLVQDVLRYAAFSRGRPQAALISDGFWTVAGVASYVVLLRLTDGSPVLLLLAWTVTGIIGGFLQAWRDRVVPALSHGVGWIIENRDLSFRYALENLSGQGAGQVATYSLVAIAGTAAVGAVRGAQTLFGPMNIVLSGTNIVLVPEGRRAYERSPRTLAMMSLLASGLFTVVGMAMLAILLLVGPDQGARLLGPTWLNARQVIFPIGLAAIAGGALAGATAGLRSLSAAKELLRIRLLTLPTTLLVPITCGVLWNVRGLAFGIAASVWWNVLLYWHVFWKVLHRENPPHPMEGVDPDHAT